MRIWAWASQPHYVAHIAPIWNALPPERRAGFHVASHAAARRCGTISGPVQRGLPRAQPDDLVLVGSGCEIPVTGGRPVLVEHGAGQSYVGVEHCSWSGGPDRDRAALFLVPNEIAAARNRARYPQIPNAVIGSPHVETLRRLPTEIVYDLVISRHWDSTLCPELGSAWYEFEPAVAKFAAAWPGRVALHAHPRAVADGRHDALRLGLPFIETFEEVVRTAACFAVDNSSTLYEFAALDRPVVVLNSDRYRLDVEHGLRFWSHADIGLQASPDTFAGPVLAALRDPPRVAALRRSIAASVFPYIDGAAERAAAAILALEEPGLA
jgi:hypothetical protein